MRLKESIDEILAQTDSQFADSFYQLLFNRHPELRPFFADTDMPVQKTKLRMALQVVAYLYRYCDSPQPSYSISARSRMHPTGIAKLIASSLRIIRNAQRKKLIGCHRRFNEIHRSNSA